MIDKRTSSVSRRRSLVIWTLFCIIAGATFLAYAASSEANGHGELVMPLDDVYIHFQYARQLAVGQPYVYNPGLPPTSGATSFLYPYVLAVGYVIGFQSLRLGLWAMSVGAVAMVCAMWLIFKLMRVLGIGEWLAFLVAVTFGISGPIAWHFMSGMETGLVVLFTLGTLYAVIKVVAAGSDVDRQVIIQFAAWATALALIRPECGVLAVVAAAVVTWKGRKNRRFDSAKTVQAGSLKRWTAVGVLIPVLAVGVQPLVNWLLTGSAVASGNAAKSILGTVPFYWDEVIRRIIGNFVQIWVEFGTGISSREGLYIMPLLLLLAIVGVGYLLVNHSLRPVGVMIILWLISGTVLLATLDTVFWHFKRYQMPFMALLFPLAGWGIAVVVTYNMRGLQSPRHQDLDKEVLPLRHGDNREVVQAEPQKRGDQRGTSVKFGDNWIGYVIIGGMLAVALVTSIQFWWYYGLNVGYVYAQPLQMARWLQLNTPDNAVIAVHDVGTMRYMGGRTTLDIVGLTTKGAADYWRNGPGAVAEFLMKEKPDYIASYGYGHGFGLGMIADTDIYGKPLVGFLVELNNNANVALAADFQGIYKPDWGVIAQKFEPLQSTTVQYLKNLTNEEVVDTINVADIDSERAHSYFWLNTKESTGFPTIVRQMNYADCGINPCSVVDAGRMINVGETFQTLLSKSLSGKDELLITRIHPDVEGTIDVYLGTIGHINEILIGSRVIPKIPGQWLEIPTFIPANSVGNGDEIHIVPHVTSGFYEPYNHIILAGNYHSETLTTKPISMFQDGAIQLGSVKLNYHPDEVKLDVNFEWYTDGSAKGDYKVFVHVYADKNKPPVAQLDVRPGNGTLPPGNWLPGVLRDTITVDLAGVPPGTYQIATGMYDPVSLERLQPTGGDDQGRLFIGEVKIKG